MRPRLSMPLILGLGAAALLHAANADELKRNCAAVRTDPKKLLSNLESCITDIFTLDTIHPIAKSIVPGGGTGPGLSLTLDKRGEWRSTFNVNGAISLRQFWSAEMKDTLVHRKFGSWNKATESFASHVYIRARGLPQMPFYGIGPHTATTNLVNFSERDTFVGIDASNPIASWLALGGTAEGIFPDVSGVHSPGVRSIDQFFAEATAPGLSKQPAFVHSEVFVRAHHADPFEFEYRIGYNFFHDTDTGHYTFRRLHADLRHNIYLERPNGKPNRTSVLSIRGVASMSDMSAGNAVPFYLQETLGGSDINNDAMLRGFADYRFRGQDLVMISTQYERNLWKWFGILAFYDTGQVADRKSDLSFANFRHSYGFGVNVWSAGKVVFRAYVGLGSGEGLHKFFGLAPGLPGQ
ncbi:MAG: hypothetical protein LAP61_23250 [Acidobacteriia bacterium]|nr:hypothetical protein [Terriglobia bacterium]